MSIQTPHPDLNPCKKRLYRLLKATQGTSEHLNSRWYTLYQRLREQDAAAISVALAVDWTWVDDYTDEELKTMAQAYTP